MKTLLETLIIASIRAANVARSCCVENDTLLVSEKSEEEANTRFERDFKTIADVLAQESAKTVIVSEFPELLNYVRGEECAEIGGVKISLQENSLQTAELLSLVVPTTTAKRMAEAAHLNSNSTVIESLPNLPMISYDDLGIWIDPIDGTAEFIAGVRGEAQAGHGLPCVTVLIGAYQRSTGVPILGVINQPFCNNGRGRIVWGVSYGDNLEWGCSETDLKANSNDNIVLLSSAEKPEFTEKLKATGWEVKSVPGAGHKLLKVALGEAAAYIVSKGTTFRWDTCAAHAILRAKGGNIISYSEYSEITYNDPHGIDTQHYCNSNGIIAYTDPHALKKIKSVIS